jgi:argininosuccinate lyase
MAEMAGAHWAQATDLAGTLVRERHMGWRTAHQIVGILCRLAEERGLSPADATPELLDEAAVEYLGEPVGLSQSAITTALDAAQFPARRILYGGPAPAALARELADLRQQLALDENSLTARQTALDDAAARLDQAIESICRGDAPAGR